MRTIEKTVYTYGELTDTAKKKAAYDFYKYFDYPWNKENKQALEKFADMFGITINHWEYDAYCHNVRYTIYAEYPEFTDIRLYNWIMFNQYHNLFVPRYIGHIGGKARHSKINKQKNCFIGYYISEAMLDPIYDFLENPKGKACTFSDLLGECIEQWGQKAQEDMAYYYSEENIEDTYNINEYEFYENGTIAQ